MNTAVISLLIQRRIAAQQDFDAAVLSRGGYAARLTELDAQAQEADETVKGELLASPLPTVEHVRLQKQRVWLKTLRDRLARELKMVKGAFP